jgi:FkbM family methyltransferase
MKGFLVAHQVGGLALSMRGKLEVLRAAYSLPEQVGCFANDELATRLVTRICRSHMTFIDIGAHIGSIISQVGRNDPTVKLIAIEPTPDKVASLRRRFPKVRLFDCAVGEEHGVVPFFVYVKNTGYNSLIRPEDTSSEKAIEIAVPLRMLDELVPDDDVDVVKIDVEGAELGVLRGGGTLLDKCRPTILFESAPDPSDASGHTKKDLFDFLASHKYSVLLPNRVAHDGPGLSVDGFLESHVYPRRTTNYFAVPVERRNQVRDRARGILGIRPA